MPQSPDTPNLRQIKHSGTRWRYRDIPTRYLGIGRTNEAQELFDSGYIGDDGIGNKDLRIHVYNGSLNIDTDNTNGQDISISAKLDNIIKSGRHTNINSIGNMSITSSINTNVTTNGNYTNIVNGAFEETINGIGGATRTIETNYNETIKNDKNVNIGQNETVTVALDSHKHTRNSTYNTSETFSVASAQNITIAANVNTSITGLEQLRLHSTNESIITSKNLGATIIETITNSCRDYILRASNKYSAQINEDYALTVGKNMAISVTNNYTQTTNNTSLKSNRVSIDTSEGNGPISMQFGSGYIEMNSAKFTTPNNNMVNLSTEFTGVKVWGAVYN